MQAKNKRPKKGEKRVDIRDEVWGLDIKAETQADAIVLRKLFTVFMDVGGGGLNLAMDWAEEEIKKAKEKRDAQSS